MNTLVKCLSTLVIILTLSACAATGSAFTPLGAAPANEGLVVFYRPKAYAGSAVKVALIDNGTEFAKLQNGQFISYTTEPGAHKFHTDTMSIDRPVEIDIEAGKTYYVATSVRMGMWVGSWELKRVFEKDALAELQTCCKSGG